MHTDRAIVTGASSGIGKAIAEVLARRGLDVIAIDVNPPGNSFSHLPGKSEYVELDVGDPVHVANFKEEYLPGDSELSVLVNSAGIGGPKASISELSDSEWAAVLTTNLTGAFNMIQASWDAIRRSGHGRIVNIGSVSARRYRARNAAYASSKAGLEALTRCAAGDLAADGVLVNCVAPGTVDSPMQLQNTDQRPLEERVREGAFANLLGRAALPEDIATTVDFLCSQANRHITGEVLTIDGGATGR